MTMKEFFKKVNLALIGAAIISIALGLVLILFTEEAIAAIQTIIGIGLIIYGVVTIVMNLRKGFNTFTAGFSIGIGILLIIMGIWLCIGRFDIATIIMLFLAVLLLVHGSVDLGFSIRSKQLGFPGWYISLIAALLTVAAGVVALIDPFKSSRAIFILLGVFILFDGVYDLFLAILMGILESRFAKEKERTDRLDEKLAEVQSAAEPEPEKDEPEVPETPAEEKFSVPDVEIPPELKFSDDEFSNPED